MKNIQTNTVMITSPLFPGQTFFTEMPVDPQPENAPKLRKDGKPKKIKQNKQKGKKSEVFAFEVADLRKMMNYFIENKSWLHYMLFVISLNMARRVGDTLSLTWEHFFNPKNGKFRTELMEIVEDKTDKLANPYINQACKDAINLYLEKTGCDPSAKNYHGFVFMQLSGTGKGNVLSPDGWRKALKRAAENCGIEYNIGTHSTRKTFGKISRMLHPNDYDSMELLQTIYNHSDTKTTKRYIGLTKSKVDQYFKDFGDFYNRHVQGGENFTAESTNPVMTLDVADLRDIITMVYQSGAENAGNSDPAIHIEAMNEFMSLIEGVAK